MKVLGNWRKVQFVVHHFQEYIVLQVYPDSTATQHG